MAYQQLNRRGFSLIELVIVVVIIAIIAAIAVPKMSRGATGASEAALMQNLAQMRTAIDLFVAEHGGTYPTNTASAFGPQMTQYSDATGATSSTKVGNFIYGPYLKAIPPLPVGSQKGLPGVTFTSGYASGNGWYFDGTNIVANLPASEVDSRSTPYNSY